MIDTGEIFVHIRRNDRVRLVAKKGLLRVVTMGIAKSDAVLGGRISVVNMGSGKTVMGEVIDAETVKVRF